MNKRFSLDYYADDYSSLHSILDAISVNDLVHIFRIPVLYSAVYTDAFIDDLHNDGIIKDHQQSLKKLLE
ncbi:hypothetical protein X798_02903 [Onchocerca flexuosa]|uniref:Uncharacterized protein n=1 Tax=Onchocerca flexuosa TaxID=387005 RepID=A0A238BZ35_9BILA|nr:hypothetical protein X798_02903 [Onchocerca flexuosa]